MSNIPGFNKIERNAIVKDKKYAIIAKCPVAAVIVNLYRILL